MLKDKDAEVSLGNQTLVGLFIAVALLGPSFTLGYTLGYRSAESASRSGLVLPPEGALPAETVSEQSTWTRQQKPGGRARTEKLTPAARGDQAAAGQIYLQMAATAKGPSAAMIDALRDNGFTAVALEVPEKPGLYRVLIGPLHEGELDKTRADLQRRGFPGGSAIKKTF